MEGWRRKWKDGGAMWKELEDGQVEEFLFMLKIYSHINLSLYSGQH